MEYYNRKVFKGKRWSLPQSQVQHELMCCINRIHICSESIDTNKPQKLNIGLAAKQQLQYFAVIQAVSYGILSLALLLAQTCLKVYTGSGKGCSAVILKQNMSVQAIYCSGAKTFGIPKKVTHLLYLLIK